LDDVFLKSPVLGWTADYFKTVINGQEGNKVGLFYRRVTGLCIISLCFAGAAHAVVYKITNLGALPFTQFTGATDINASGQVVGISSNGTNELGNPSDEGFLYSGGMLSPMGPILGRTYNTANGINNSGQIVGTTYGSNDHPVYNAYIYDNGVVTDLGPGLAKDINDAGQVIGVNNSPFSRDGYLYENGVKTNLGALPGHQRGEGAAINESGQSAGTSFGTGSNVRAFLYENGVMTDLGTLEGGFQSYGSGINDLGQVVGNAFISNTNPLLIGTESRAFVSIDGIMTNLGTFSGGTSSAASDINNLGQIVGGSNGGTNGSTAFLYQDGEMLNLYDLLVPGAGDGWYLYGASAINDSGQIVGSGTFYGDEVAFLLSPVPLPAAFWLFASGLTGLIGINWRRQA